MFDDVKVIFLGSLRYAVRLLKKRMEAWYNDPTSEKHIPRIIPDVCRNNAEIQVSVFDYLY